MAEQKSTDQMLNEKVFPSIILVLCLVGVILYFTTDFSGWFVYPSVYGYVWLFSSKAFPWSVLLILPLIGGFVITGFFSFMTLFKSSSHWANQYKLIFWISITIASYTVLGAIIFLLTVLDATEWWFDAAFWAGLVGGGLNALFSYLILRSRGESIKLVLRRQKSN